MSIKALMTKVKRPKVKKFIGKVMRRTIGRIKAFIKANNKAAKRATLKLFTLIRLGKK